MAAFKGPRHSESQSKLFLNTQTGSSCDSRKFHIIFLTLKYFKLFLSFFFGFNFASLPYFGSSPAFLSAKIRVIFRPCCLAVCRPLRNRPRGTVRSTKFACMTTNDILESNRLDEGEPPSPVKQIRFLTVQDSVQHTHANLVEGQMEGSFPSSSSRSSHDTSDNPAQAQPALPPPDCAPPHKVRLARFPKDEMYPCPAERYTVDVKADKNFNKDAGLNHIPDFRGDWGSDEKWKLYRCAYRTTVTHVEIEERELHGHYVIFATHSPDFEKNKHKIFKGEGRHVHDDFFIAKIERRADANGWTRYIDMPDQFFSATTEDGKKVYETCLLETTNDMLGMLLA